MVPPLPADAAVVCQKKKKVFLRPGPACKKKERLVTDLAALGGKVDGLGTQLGTVDTQLGLVESQIGLECLKGPTKAFTAPSVVGVPARRTLGCRTLDGNAAACAAAYEVSAFGEARSCFYYVGRCLACSDDPQSVLACVNACQPPECPAAPAKVFAGGPGNEACQFLKSQAECENAFHLGGGGRSATCFWDTTGGTPTCRGCGPSNEQAGRCTNGCGAPPVTCATRPGLPKSCSSATTQGDCETRWLDGFDYGISCYWNTTDPQNPFCTDCDQREEFLFKRCTNLC